MFNSSRCQDVVVGQWTCSLMVYTTLIYLYVVDGL